MNPKQSVDDSEKGRAAVGNARGGRYDAILHQRTMQHALRAAVEERSVLDKNFLKSMVLQGRRITLDV